MNFSIQEVKILHSLKLKHFTENILVEFLQKKKKIHLGLLKRTFRKLKAGLPPSQYEVTAVGSSPSRTELVLLFMKLNLMHHLYETLNYKEPNGLFSLFKEDYDRKLQLSLKVSFRAPGIH
jgi:hypothetical protein